MFLINVKMFIIGYYYNIYLKVWDRLETEEKF